MIYEDFSKTPAESPLKKTASDYRHLIGRMMNLTNYPPRNEAPERDNKNYIHTSAGGFNRCIEIANGSCLPNCVGYAWGRWRELLGYDPKLSRRNAEDWYGCTEDGYKRSKTPKLFAVACWKKGKLWDESDGAGHVAVVEEVKTNGDFVTSESVYGGARFRSKTYKKQSGYYLAKGYEFQGFILFPAEVKVYTTGDYRVTDASLLHVRTGPCTDYRKKRYSEFTKNARSQIYELVRYKADGYVMMVEFTVYEVKNNWGRTPSGWVCLDYCTKI